MRNGFDVRPPFLRRASTTRFFFQAEDGIRGGRVTGVRRVLFRSFRPLMLNLRRCSLLSDSGRTKKPYNAFSKANAAAAMNGNLILISPKNAPDAIPIIKPRPEIGRASCRKKA